MWTRSSDRQDNISKTLASRVVVGGAYREITGGIRFSVKRRLLPTNEVINAPLPVVPGMPISLLTAVKFTIRATLASAAILLFLCARVCGNCDKANMETVNGMWFHKRPFSGR